MVAQEQPTLDDCEKEMLVYNLPFFDLFSVVVVAAGKVTFTVLPLLLLRNNNPPVQQPTSSYMCLYNSLHAVIHNLSLSGHLFFPGPP